jgi:hypothetical protein
MFSNRDQHKTSDLNPVFPTINTLNSLQLCNNDFDRKIKVVFRAICIDYFTCLNFLELAASFSPRFTSAAVDPRALLQITVLDWDPEKGLSGAMSMLGG